MPISSVPSSCTTNNVVKDGKNFPTVVSDSSFLEKQTKFPAGFIWPERDDQPSADPVEELTTPLEDLEGFLRRRDARRAELVRGGEPRGINILGDHQPCTAWTLGSSAEGFFRLSAREAAVQLPRTRRRLGRRRRGLLQRRSSEGF